MSRPSFWQPHEVTLLRQYYCSSPYFIDWLEGQLPYTRRQIQCKARRLGLMTPRKAIWPQRPWTVADEQQLTQYVTQGSIVSISNLLQRSPMAIRHKMWELGLAKSKDNYTIHSLTSIFGVSDNRITAWIDKGWLKATHRYSERPNDFWNITPQAIKQFVKQYPTAFDIHKVDQLAFLDLIIDLAPAQYA